MRSEELIKRGKVERKVIVDAARAAIAQAREEGYEISTTEARRLMKVARTAPKFVLADWRAKGCGCLVGNLIGEDFSIVNLPTSLHAVGLNFDHLVSEQLPESFYYPTKRMCKLGRTWDTTILTVKD